MSSEIQVQSANIENIKDVIYEVRGQKVMLDYDLASIYIWGKNGFIESGCQTKH